MPGQALQQFGRDLTEEARAGLLDPVIGRDKEVTRTLQVTCGPGWAGGAMGGKGGEAGQRGGRQARGGRGGKADQGGMSGGVQGRAGAGWGMGGGQ